MTPQIGSTQPTVTERSLDTSKEAIGGGHNLQSTIATNHPPAQLTLVTSTVPDRFVKSYSLVGDELTKTSAGQLVRGEYQVLEIDNVQGLEEILVSLAPNKALTYGVPRRQETQGAISSRKAARLGELTRTRDEFDWPNGTAIFFLDFDLQKGAEPLTAEELWKMLVTAVPELAGAPAVIVASASSYIFNVETGVALKGAGGWHVYVLIKEGRDIPRAGSAIYDMAWMAGHGRYDISSAGTMLERCLVDAMVWQPERLDFAAGAFCAPPLGQRRPAPLVINPNAVPFDTRQIQTAQAVDELDKLKAEARAAVADEAKKAKAAWVESRVAEGMHKDKESDPEKREDKIKRLRNTYTRATEDGFLLGDFPLLTEDGRNVTVGEILDSPEQWHGKRFADPLEPEYRNDHRIAWANLQSGGRPTLYSHARGGRLYILIRAPQIVQVMGGEMPRVIHAVQDHVHRACEVYQRGGELVRVADRSLLGVQQAWLRTHLETVSLFQIFRKEKQVQVDCPGDLPQRILANRGGWPFFELVGIETAPTMRPDGSLLDRPGYDKVTGLLLLDDHSNNWPSIPSNPTPEEARVALLRLWEPFAYFPFVNSIDRAVALAALLTAVVRRILPTAPGFGVNAFQMGTGKTKLAQCIGILTSGRVPSVAPWAENTEEQRKTLMAAFLSGPGAILLDNIERALSSSELCAALTGETYEDRRLGFSERVKASTRVMVTVTGNNLCIAGDLSRRILPITLDHGVERPEILSFPFDPVARVAERWLSLRADALTILRAFVVAGRPAKGVGRMGSFEDWDGLVRQCVVWLRDNELAPFELADPADAVSDTINADPDNQKLQNLLYWWWDKFRDKPTKASDLAREGIHINSCYPFVYNELGDTLLEIAGDGNNINPRRLGRWIERHAGRLLGGKKIETVGRTGGSCRWRVVHLGG
ncbi:MAG: hypothetical protein WC256_12955 [Desulfurivibrionaceae bacterium]|jgi:hypothetical protein